MNIIICPIVHKHHISYSIFVQNQDNPLYLELFDDDKINSQKNIASLAGSLNANSYNCFVFINSENIKIWHDIKLPSLPKSRMNSAIQNALADDVLNSDNNYAYDKNQSTAIAIQNNILNRIITQLTLIKQFKLKYIAPLSFILQDNTGIVQTYDDKNVYSFKSVVNNSNVNNTQLSGFTLLKSQANLASNLAPNVNFISINNINNLISIWQKLEDKAILNSLSNINLYNKGLNDDSSDDLVNFYSVMPKPKWLAYLLVSFIILHMLGLNILIYTQQYKIKQYNNDIKQMFAKVSKDPIQDAVLQLQKMQNKSDENLSKLDDISTLLVKYNDKIKELKFSNNFWQVSFKQDIDSNIFTQEAKAYSLNVNKQQDFWVFE
jgi:hypothetical protein